MFHLRRIGIFLALVAAFGGGVSASAAAFAAGTKLDQLKVGQVVYDDVVIRSISTRTVVFTHSGGMSSVLLRTLSPELQDAFGYDMELDLKTEAIPQETPIRSKAARPTNTLHSSQPVRNISKFDQLLKRFGQAPDVKRVVDMKADFLKLDLSVKSQGRRPSCSVFAVVSALEYQNAELCGRAEKLSEEYLIWATQKTTARALSNLSAEPVLEQKKTENKDAGFSISDVVTALRAYGIPLQDKMPNSFGVKMEDINDPSPEIIAEAQNRRRVFIHSLPGGDAARRISNIAHALNAGIPVVIGIRWPNARAARSGYLSEQIPVNGYDHAVTLVGYKCTSGRLADAVFSYKNSYGIDWGVGGYGQITYSYLTANLLDAVILELQPSPGD